MSRPKPVFLKEEVNWTNFSHGNPNRFCFGGPGQPVGNGVLWTIFEKISTRLDGIQVVAAWPPISKMFSAIAQTTREAETHLAIYKLFYCGLA